MVLTFEEQATELFRCSRTIQASKLSSPLVMDGKENGKGNRNVEVRVLKCLVNYKRMIRNQEI